MHNIFFISLITSKFLLAADFYISEIYRTKRQADKHSSWIELANISNHQISVTNIKLEIFNKHDDLIYQFKKNLKIDFDDYVILSDSKKITDKSCLKSSVSFIKTDGLVVRNKSDQKICVTINNDIKECTELTRHDEFFDGISLGPIYSKNNTTPVYVSEICHIGNQIFATPGAPARACFNDDEFYKDIIEDCNTLRPSLYRSSEIKPIENMPPKLLLTPPHNVKLKASGDNYDIYKFSFCQAALASKLICHEFSPPKSLVKDIVYAVDINSMHDRDMSVFYQVRDLFGLTSTVDAQTQALAKEHKVDKLSDIKLNKTMIHAGLSLELSLKEENLPVNYLVKDAHGIILAGAFSNAGEHKIVIEQYDSLHQYVLELQNRHQRHSFLISSNSHHASCHMVDSNNIVILFMIILYMRNKLFLTIK